MLILIIIFLGYKQVISNLYFTDHKIVNSIVTKVLQFFVLDTQTLYMTTTSVLFKIWKDFSILLKGYPVVENPLSR